MRDTISRDYKPAKGIASLWGNAPVFVILSVWSAFSLFSLFWILTTSLKSDFEFTSRSPWALPGKWIALTPISASGETVDTAGTNLVDGKPKTVWAMSPEEKPSPQTLVFHLREAETVAKLTMRAGERKDLFPSGSVRFFCAGREVKPVGGPRLSRAGDAATYKFEPFEAERLTIEVTPLRDQKTGLWSAEIAEVLAYRDRIRLQWINYKLAWTIAKMGHYTFNSIIVTCFSVVSIVIISAMASYAITKIEWRGRQVFFYYFLAGMAVPASLLLVPLFMLMKNLNIEQLNLFPVAGYWLISIKDFYLVDSRLGLILIYTTMGLPFTTFVLAGFFRTLPSALAEAAAIDGASEYQVFWKIFLPLAKPGLITVSIFNFLYTWNEYQFALVFISNPRLKTLPLGLYSLSAATRHSTNWTALFAGLVILMLPTIAVFILLEDRITRGLTMGALKE